MKGKGDGPQPSGWLLNARPKKSTKELEHHANSIVVGWGGAKKTQRAEIVKQERKKDDRERVDYVKSGLATGIPEKSTRH